MMNLTTSKSISLKFTLYTMGIVFLFGAGVNLLFFQQWYKTEQTRLENNSNGPQLPGLKGRFARANMEDMTFSQDIFSQLKKNTIIYNLSVLDDEYVLFKADSNTITISNVTRLVEAQSRILVIFLILLITFSLITYAVSLVFVQSSLKNINKLLDYVRKLNINTLDAPVPLSGPDDDEIRVIGEALQQMINTIKEQTDSLKDFVTHASHELKTPLMSLSAVMDAAQKTGNHEKGFGSAKKILQTINSLFDTLLSLTKREYHNIEKTSLDIVPLIQGISEELKKLYITKNITCTLSLPEKNIVSSNEDIFRIIFFNLLQNAYKYTPDGGNIEVQGDEKKLSITNSGPGIDPQHHKHIWQKFWKDHGDSKAKDGFGLGLYLVKLLVNKHHWQIGMKSEPDVSTTFSIFFERVKE